MNEQTVPLAGTRSNSEVLGEILWLYSHSPLHRSQRLDEIEQFVLPAVKHQRYRIYKRGGFPIGYVAIARLAKEVEHDWLSGKAALRPDDWISGDRLWIMQFVVPFGDTLDVRKKLWIEPELFKKPIWGLRPNRTGGGFHVVQFGKYRFRDRRPADTIQAAQATEAQPDAELTAAETHADSATDT